MSAAKGLDRLDREILRLVSVDASLSLAEHCAAALGYSDKKDPNHNDYFPVAGNHIAMPKPLSDKQVDYTDGTPPTVDNYARDVTAFLTWVAEPKLEERKKTGLRATIFLLIFAGLMYFTKKRVWADAH